MEKVIEEPKIHPDYWGDPVGPVGAYRASGADQYKIERNRTPSLYWEKTPQGEALNEAIRDHVDVRFQCLAVLFVYLHNSQLMLVNKTAPNQVTSPLKTAERTEEAHPHLIAGLQCTTREEVKNKGIHAVWARVAGESHLGLCLQATHRLWTEINNADRTIESSNTGASGHTLRDVIVDIGRLVAEGLIPPSYAFRQACEAHATACGSNHDSQILKLYQAQSGIYIKRLAKDPLFLSHLTGFEKPDSPKTARDFQQQISQEMLVAREYRLLVDTVHRTTGYGAHSTEKTNGFLHGLMECFAPKNAAIAHLVVEQESPSKTKTQHITKLVADPKFMEAVQDEVGAMGPSEMVKQIAKGSSPLKGKLGELLKLQRPPNDASFILCQAVRRLDFDQNLDRTWTAHPVGLSLFLSWPCQLAHLSPSSRYFLTHQPFGERETWETRQREHQLHQGELVPTELFVEKTMMQGFQFLQTLGALKEAE